jgi:NADPH2:quinone reductase
VQPIDTLKLFFRSQSVLGLHLSAIFQRPALMKESLKHLLDWIEQGKLKIQIGHVLKLAEVRQAHELMSNRQNYGKIVLVP